MFPVPPVLVQCSSSTCRGCPPPVTSSVFVASVGALAAVQLLKFHIIVKVPQYIYPAFPHLNISTINTGHRPASSVGLPTLPFSTPFEPAVVFFFRAPSLTVNSAVQTTCPHKHIYTRRSSFVFLQHRCVHAMMC